MSDLPLFSTVPITRVKVRPARDAYVHRPDRSTLAAFRSGQVAVRAWMLEGRDLSAVEDDVIDPAPLDNDWKAALWLFSWSLFPSTYQLAEVEAHVDLLSSCLA